MPQSTLSPAGPIPVPYPDTSFSKDMLNGSKTVKIKGQEVMLKDQSFYKTAPLGDEAATQGLGAGVITHVITGKTYFNMWSMDVIFEGQNVDRHTDITTSNHASLPGNESVPTPNLGMMAPTGPIELECKPGWTDCQKKQMKAKAAKMDAAAKQRGSLQTRSTTKLSAAKASWQQKFARDWNKPNPEGWPPFSDPSKQGEKFYDDCAKTSDPLGQGMQADHVLEVQLGGSVKGPFSLAGWNRERRVRTANQVSEVCRQYQSEWIHDQELRLIHVNCTPGPNPARRGCGNRSAALLLQRHPATG